METHNVPDQLKAPHGRLDCYLHAVAESLHRIVLAISSKLRHMHILRSQMGDVKGDFDIWERLGSHVEQIPVIEKPTADSPSARQRADTHRTVDSPVITKGSDLGQLGQYNIRKAILNHHPHIDEQLRSSTMEHINLALHLAREGNKDSARLHIELAQSALHTASRFMSHEEYELFEQKVEHRLEAIVKDDRSTPPRS